MYIAVKSFDVEVRNPYYTRENSGFEPRTIKEQSKDYVIFNKDSDVAGYKSRGYTVYSLAGEVDAVQTVTTKIITKPVS